jgi:hypothetical protein
MQYFPDTMPKGREPHRTYTFNVLNTLRPEYVRSIIEHAQSQRNEAGDESREGEAILMSSDWQARLE